VPTREATMAAGYGRGDQGRLIDRFEATLAETSAVPRSPARHCFADGEPALLVEWRQGSGDGKAACSR
jgi:hypothetical protein